MDSNQISYIVALLFAIAILVILIVILAKYRGGDGTTDEQQHNTNVKVNWLYWINIVEVGLIVVFGLLSLFAYRKYCLMGNCMKA
jgi:uncharacterized sodium:solute symporter family permease YidK